MNKWIKWGIVVLVVIGLTILGVRTFTPRENEELSKVEKEMPSDKKQILNVNAQIVRPHILTDKLFVSGKLIPDEEVDLSFETSGKIVDINFQEGTMVSEGQLLAKVNDSQLQAQLARLEAQMPLAEDRVFRQNALLQRDAVSKEAYEQVKTELATLHALTKIKPIKVEFAVPERYARKIRKGTKLSFKVEGHLDAFEAEVYAMESSIDPETHALTVRAIYPNTRAELLPGRYADVELRQSEIQDAIAIPSEAIVPEMGQNKVFVYRSGVAMPVDVEIGIRTEAEVQILRGLAAGDTILTSGTLQLRTGMPVKLDNIN